MPSVNVAAVEAQVAQYSQTIIKFLRDLCAIPSMDSQIGPVGERAKEEMHKLGFDEVWFDSMGNIVGRIGDGPRKIVVSRMNDATRNATAGRASCSTAAPGGAAPAQSAS